MGQPTEPRELRTVFAAYIAAALLLLFAVIVLPHNDMVAYIALVACLATVATGNVVFGRHWDRTLGRNSRGISQGPT